MTLRAEVSDDVGALGAIADDWRSLAVTSGNAFLTPEWCSVWFRHYDDTATPLVVAVREGDELVGVLPLARSGRTIRFAGDNVGDRFHPLAAPDREHEVVRAAGAALGGRGSRLVLRNVDAGAPWRSTLVAAWPTRTRATRLSGAVLPYVPIAGETWDSFLAVRSRNFRSQVRRKERALVRDHGARFRCTDAAGRVATDVARFFALHAARWDTRGGSASATNRTRAFHADFAAAALAQGWLRLWFLEVDGVEVAAFYGWRVGHRYAYYLAGFDPAWSDASVGLVLLAHTVRSAIAEGAAEYDLLLGPEEYKARFATAERAVETVAVAGVLDPTRLTDRFDASARRLASRLSPETRRRVRAGVGGMLARLPGETAR